MRNGWYITSASAGANEDASYILFELVDDVRIIAYEMFRAVSNLAESLESCGGVHMNGVVNMVVLTAIPDKGITLTDKKLEKLDNGYGPVYVGNNVDINAIPDDLVWRSECHALRVMSTGSVYLRGLSRYNSAEAETNDIDHLIGLKVKLIK